MTPISLVPIGRVVCGATARTDQRWGAVTSDSVIVRALDAINGPPVLDLKPYYPQYDRIENAVVPEWADRLMEGYF